MKFPEKYIKRGKVKLHSGQTSNIFYDVCGMLTEKKYEQLIFDSLPTKVGLHYVGIATGGAIISSLNYRWSMIKDNELKGNVKDDYCLIDDVCTTESSIKKAIKIIGKKPKYIFVVVDRRKKRTLQIMSIFKPKNN